MYETLHRPASLATNRLFGVGNYPLKKPLSCSIDLVTLYKTAVFQSSMYMNALYSLGFEIENKELEK